MGKGLGLYSLRRTPTAGEPIIETVGEAPQPEFGPQHDEPSVMETIAHETAQLEHVEPQPNPVDEANAPKHPAPEPQTADASPPATPVETKPAKKPRAPKAEKPAKAPSKKKAAKAE